MIIPAPMTLDRIAIVGVGLIGGSIAAALRKRGLTREVVGIGRNPERLEAACAAGLIDTVVPRDTPLPGCSLAVVCTPVDRIAQDVLMTAGYVESGTIITDAGSVKGAICQELAETLSDQVSFVGSHPLAGSERGGWEHADADLFEGRTCVVTPTTGLNADATAFVERFWQSLGMRTLRMSPQEHDRTLALTSHLPHVAAAALASLLEADQRPLAATGFRDTTRVASGDPRLWAPILRQNAAALTEDIDRMVDRLTELKQALSESDAARLVRLLGEGKTARDSLNGAP